VLWLGTRRLSEPPPSVREALETLPTLERLEQIAGRLRKASTWPEALTPG
jgi:hypothetical protein